MLKASSFFINLTQKTISLIIVYRLLISIFYLIDYILNLNNHNRYKIYVNAYKIITDLTKKIIYFCSELKNNNYEDKDEFYNNSSSIII